MKKILFINQYGAPGKYHNFKRTAELASNFAKSGYEVVVLCSKTLHNSRNNIKFKNEMYDNVKYVYFKTIGYNNNFTRLIGMIQFSIKVYFYSLFKIKPDVVISSIQSIFAGLSGYYISRHFKVKHILEIRDLWPETLIQFGKTKRNSILSIILRTIEKKIYRKSDYIVPLMKNVELYFHDVLKIKKYGNVHHINNGVDFEKFKSLESKYSRRLFFNDSNVKNCVYTGSIGYANDIDLIIETAELALANKANINFHFYGEGNLKNKWRYILGADIYSYFFPIPLPGAGLSKQLVCEKGLMPGVSLGVQFWSVGSLSATLGIGKTLPFGILFFLPAVKEKQGKDLIYVSTDCGYSDWGSGRYLEVTAGYDFIIDRLIDPEPRNIRIGIGLKKELEWSFVSSDEGPTQIFLVIKGTFPLPKVKISK